MSWIEVTNHRTQRSRTYQDNANPLKRAWSGALAALHYESELGSGIYDAQINCTPERIDNAQLDGWRVIANGWHYALGQPADKSTDGWVGFGGRQGDHWFKFRLARVGYLHWPTRAWNDIGDAPNYNRANLSQLPHTITIGPNNDEVNVSTIATWANIWNTPGGGELSVSWHSHGDGLKEEIIINQAGREWIQANRPPSTPLDETWFGFVFQLDWSDIPRVVRDNILQNVDADFADDGKAIELRDALDRLLAFLPLSDVTVNKNSKLEQRQPLRKRFWKGPDENHYLLLGVRCDTLNTMPAGDLVFDPTVDKDLAAEADSGCTLGAAFQTGTIWNGYDGQDENAYYRFTGVTIEGTIDVSNIQVRPFALSGTPEIKIYGVDQDNPAAPTSAAEYNADALTTAAVDWDGPFTAGAYRTSPSLNAIFQELVDTYTIDGDAVMLQLKNDHGTPAPAEDFGVDGEVPAGDGDEPKLHIEYTAVAGGHMTLWGRYWGP